VSSEEQNVTAFFILTDKEVNAIRVWKERKGKGRKGKKRKGRGEERRGKERKMKDMEGMRVKEDIFVIQI
jgi:hypothetical protein